MAALVSKVFKPPKKEYLPKQLNELSNPKTLKTEGRLPYVRYLLEPTHRFDEIFSAIDIGPILFVVSKKAHNGALVRLNYSAMIHALLLRIFERIPTIKDLVRCLQNDLTFQGHLAVGTQS